MEVLREKQEFKIPFRDIERGALTNDSYTMGIEFLNSTMVPGASVVLGVEGRISAKNEEVINLIKSFVSLNDNWDDNNAREIPIQTISQAIEVVEELNAHDIDVYFTSPGPNQEILLLLKNGLNELELIIYPDKQKFVKFEKNEFVEQGNFDLEMLHVLVALF